MCGITARAADEDVLEALLTGLDNLEYRGYDSAGVALRSEADLRVCKCAGETDELEARANDAEPAGQIGLGHTRWSTHGRPTDENAHPHTDCAGEVAVVHNGILDNHEALREELAAAGHEFDSETDTEVVPHLIEERLAAGDEPEAAFRAAVERLEGSYAIVATLADREALYATRSGSPLVLGIGDDGYFLASDVPAFLEYTDTVVYLQDGDVVTVTPRTHAITDLEGSLVVREPETVDWAPEDAEKGRYDHYMRKEIDEQPGALRRAIEGRIDLEASGTDGGASVPDGDATAAESASDGGAPAEGASPAAADVRLEDFPPGSFEGVERVHLVACGTSYHAAVYAQRLLAESGVPATTHRAGEFATTAPPLSGDALVVAVSQSGETADTLEAVRAVADDARTLAVTNVVGSTLAREADDALFIRAGPEIGVAATKTFSSQVATLLLLRERLVRDVTGSPTERADEVLAGLERLPDDVEHVVETSRAREVARRSPGRDAHFFVGRDVAHPVALEGALKFKEITYEHAEGFTAGELKHGPLALVTPQTEVVAVFTGRHVEHTRKNVREVQARDAPVLAVADESTASSLTRAEEVLTFPDTEPELAGLLANVHLQLLSYHAAAAMDRPIDKPRNLAKSVTVE